MIHKIQVLLLLLILIQNMDTFYSFSINSISKKSFRSIFKNNLQMSLTSIDFSNAFGILPLCITATSKTTTINDPTAGMSPDEITNYISNVGGGMCGYPEPIRAAIGLGLNLSLIVFGIFTVSYVILGGLNFALDKNVEDLITKQVNEYEDNDEILAFAENAGFPLKITRKKTTSRKFTNNSNNMNIIDNEDNNDKNIGIISREERRIKSRIKKMK